MSEHKTTETRMAARSTRDDIIMRGLSYEPVDGPYTHRRWWRIELAPPPQAPSACIQAFSFWLGERAIYG